MEYLSFEKPIEELEIQLNKALELADETGVDMAKTIDDIRKKLVDKKKEIYGNLSAWERGSTLSPSTASIYTGLHRSADRRQFYRITRRSRCERRQSYDRWLG